MKRAIESFSRDGKAPASFSDEKRKELETITGQRLEDLWSGTAEGR